MLLKSDDKAGSQHNDYSDDENERLDIDDDLSSQRRPIKMEGRFSQFSSFHFKFSFFFFILFCFRLFRVFQRSVSAETRKTHLSSSKSVLQSLSLFPLFLSSTSK